MTYRSGIREDLVRPRIASRLSPKTVGDDYTCFPSAKKIKPNFDFRFIAANRTLFCHVCFETHREFHDPTSRTQLDHRTDLPGAFWVGRLLFRFDQLLYFG